MPSDRESTSDDAA